RVADLIAYVNHDIDDAIRAGVLRAEGLPGEAVAVVGSTSSERIATMAKDVVVATEACGGAGGRTSDAGLEATPAGPAFRVAAMVKEVVVETEACGASDVRMSDAVLDATLQMRAFLFEAVYENDVATAEFSKASGILGGLWERVRARPDEFLDVRIVESEGL